MVELLAKVPPVLVVLVELLANVPPVLREPKILKIVYERFRVKMSPNAAGAKNIEGTSASAMTGRNTSPTTAAVVVDTIKQVWYLVVVIHSVLDIFWCHR